MDHHLIPEQSGEAFVLRELSATGATPSTGKWKVHPKSDGLFLIEDTGTLRHLRAGFSLSDLDVVGTTAVITEETLASVSLEAAALAVNGQLIRAYAWGTTAANANIKTIRLKFGATVVAINDVTIAPVGVVWELRAIVARTGAATQEAVGNGVVGAVAQTVSNTQPAETLSGAVAVALTGQNGIAAANEIVCRGLLVEVMQ